MKIDNVRQFLKRWLPYWCVLPLCAILVVNYLVYFGSGRLTADRYHYDLTLGFDRAVPLVPEFVWIYILAFGFWGLNYILAAQRGRSGYARFVATDLAVHLCCFAVFMILPTTNVRPVLEGATLSEKMLQFIYDTDGGSLPSNLLPSIHCYVSWLSWRGVRGVKAIPLWYQRFSLVMALLVIVSTQVLKQHYIVDAIAAVLLVEFFWNYYRKENRFLWTRKLFRL